MSIARDFLYASAQKLSGIVHLHIKTLELPYIKYCITIYYDLWHTFSIIEDTKHQSSKTYCHENKTLHHIFRYAVFSSD
ncbi:hypothetical protein TBC1_12591 [Lentimicrobium saccharophilum]|uniref:Uncharacterized protein n=1 Tax=Lentimicrobium saccharophilum TaxID=1678841 RepID=A0A0S7BUY5_9BACT|nr:hypothetical protein TBC1_12591 [Lentimicrobium saccharophilum]